jgi:hypothetical protein
MLSKITFRWFTRKTKKDKRKPLFKYFMQNGDAQITENNYCSWINGNKNS